MSEIDAFLRGTELERAAFSEFRERMARAEADGDADVYRSRSYPGYPRWPLERGRPRRWGAGLEAVLAARRCRAVLDPSTPDRRILSRLLEAAHGITGD